MSATWGGPPDGPDRAPAQGQDSRSQEGLWQALYDELRRSAGAIFRTERADHTLQPTALIHEAWLKIASTGIARDVDETHAVALAVTAMRHVLIDHARARHRKKRGGGVLKISLDEGVAADTAHDVDDLLAVAEALEHVEARSPRMARLIELRFFGGLSVEEMGEMLGRTPVMVRRDLRAARALMARALGGDEWTPTTSGS